MHLLLSYAPLRWLILLATFVALACIEIVMARCNPPQAPDHAFLIYERHSSPPAYLPNGYTVRVVCEELFQLVGEGNGFMTCRKRKWTNSYSCIAICDRLPYFQRGEITYSADATIASYSCTAPGYRLKGNGTRRCNGDGTWSGTLPRCQGIPQCEQPQLEQHLIQRRLAGRKIDELWVVGTILQFSCEEQFGSQSDSYPVIECTSRDWNSTVPVCGGIPKCEQPQLGQHLIQRRFAGIKLDELWTVGTVLQFSCEEPFLFANDQYPALECTSGNWNSTLPVCRDSRCSQLLDNIENGQWTAVDRSYVPGDVVDFTCNRGYRPTSSSQRVCVLKRQSDGSFLPMWEGETPRCEEIQCSRPSGEIENGETIVSSTSVGGTTTFRCRPGFVLDGNQVITCQEDGQWNGTIPSCYDIMLSPFKNKLGVDIFFLFDASDSVGMENFEKSKRFAKRLVRQIGVTRSRNSLRVGAALFSYSAEVAFHTTDFTSTDGVINRGINSIQFKGGGTDINEALNLVNQYMLPYSQYRRGSYKAIFIITDGNAYVDRSTVNTARYLKSLGISIYCVAISEDVMRWELLGLATRPLKEHAFLLRKYGSIKQLVAEVFLKTDDCGVSENTASRGRVVGGYDANPGAWPWQVLLEIRTGRNILICGGVLIDRFWVVTVASCLPSDPTTKITVVLGTTDLTRPRHQEIEVEEVIPHPEYDAHSYQNDIGLLKLSKAAVLNANVRAVCLPDRARVDRLLRSGPSNIHTAIVTGWGHNKSRSVNDLTVVERVDRLQQLALPLKSTEECRASLEGDREQLFFDESMFCAGYENARLGACIGDSGGPLVKKAFQQGQRRWTLIGLTSWGRGCALRNELDFFTNVPYVVDWIKETMLQT